MIAATIAAPELHTAAWYAARRTGIGGSDIPILAGLSTYNRTAHDIYLEKLGLIEPQPSSPAMEVGSVIEDAIATLYTRRTGRALMKVGHSYRHPAFAFAIGNVDRRVRGERRLVEIKNRRVLDRAGLPADIECQVQWYLGVTRYPVADVAILVGGNDLRIIEVQADANYFADLLVIASDFWVRVITNDPPPLDGSDGAARYLAARYPWHTNEALVPATTDINVLVTEMRDAQGVKRWGEEREAAAKNAIKALLGESPGVQGPDYRITWRRSADYRQIDWRIVAESYADQPDYASVVETATKTIAGVRRFVPTFEGAANDE